MSHSDEQIERACQDVGASASQKCAFPVELEEAFYLCATGGMKLSEFVWIAKRHMIEAAKSQHKTKAEAACSLGIAAQSLWRIENDIHK